MTAVYAGEIIFSSQNQNHETRITNLETDTTGPLRDLGLVGYALQTANISSTNAGGHVETFGASGMYTFDAVAGRKYKAQYEGGMAGTSGDKGNVRLRYAAGATVDATGTILDGALKTSSLYATASYVPITVTGIFEAPTTGQYTVGVSIDWYSGGANDVTLFYVASEVTPILIVECVKL